MAIRVYLFLTLLLLGVAYSDVCNQCYECDDSDPNYDEVTRVCCACAPSTSSPTTTTTSAPSESGDTAAPTSSTTEEPATTEPYSCAHWTSSRGIFGVAGGYPLNVCYAKWGGATETSESYIYKCSDDHSTVEWWKWIGTTECDDDIATAVKLPFSFDPSLYPEDDYNCAGDPCDYYIIEDGTAHPDQTCPYDVGTEYTSGENDYATWEHKLVLQGCQTFDGLTSTYAKCNEDDGISIFKYSDPYCRGTAVATTFLDGTLQCNYGTGTSVYCFDEEDPDMNMTDASTTTADPDKTPSPVDPQLCSWGNCDDPKPSTSGRYKPSQFIGVCIIFMVAIWFKL